MSQTQPAAGFELDLAAIQSRIEAAIDWARAEALSVDFGLQLVLVGAAMLLAFATKRQTMAVFARIFHIDALQRFKRQAVRFIQPIAGPAMAWILLSAALAVLDSTTGFDVYLLRSASNLMGAWAAIRLLSSFISEPFWSRTVALIAWTLAALNILGWLDPTALFLDGLGFSLGADTEGNDRRISALTVIRAAIVLAVFYWVASFLSRLLSTRVEHLPSLNPSARILITKAAQIVLMATAGLMALSALGINLSALAIFGGAIGLGIGFGLQKIFSNLVSGVILLLDRSIKPGDVVTVDETYGKVSTLGMRFASVKTRDGHEHLIPNEEFITSKVINWSYSDPSVRIKRTIGISYNSDVRLARELVVKAAESVARVAASPATRCHLIGFGDNSVDLQIRFWILDPENGVYNVTSEVLLAIWDTFQEHGIEFPFPQRDVHLVGSDTIKVEMANPD
ncbi:mechanosensitive ion channel family protein [Maricaulis sp. MIT060901]|uniref:mechanosensitive ion channel family protein n=1 Tax=Maricaulis sp. MIT060901 TaxID=3096993 RepID=UPI00399A2EAA